MIMLERYTWKYEKFFDPLSFYMPKSLKEIIKYSRYFYETNHIVASAIYKLAEYPITDFIYDTTDQQLINEYKEILEEKIDIKKLLIEIGLDYFVYGNVFLTVFVPFNRIFTCPKCGQILNPEKDDNGNVNWQISNGKIYMSCSKHGRVPTNIDDVPIKSDDFTIMRWDPMNVTIDYSELTGKAHYYFDIPKDDISKATSDPEFIKEVRRPFLDAILQNKASVRFENDKLIVFQRPSINSEFKGWGLPPLLHVLQLLFYIQMLRKSQFAIAEDRMVNFRYLYPPIEYVLQGGPFSTNLGMWRNQVEDALRIWRDDPNNMPVFPVPVAYGTIGGEGKQLLLIPEIQTLIEELIVGLQVPREFVFGGLTWTGTSVSLRMLENHYLNYRQYLSNVIDKIISTIAKVKDIPEIKIHMRPFRMADDLQRAQIKMNLASGGKISDETLLQEFDLDYNTELQKIMNETQIQMALQGQLQQLTQQPAQQQQGSGNEQEIEEDLPEQRPPRRENPPI